LKICFLY